MTVVVNDNVKKVTDVQNPEVNPGVNPQQQNMKKKLIMIADLLSITGSLVFLTAGVINLFLDTSFRP